VPALIRAPAGKKLPPVAAKDGHRYGFNIVCNSLQCHTPATRVENFDVTFAVGKPVHF
jgi:uncharacterized protein involved in high-affinity Fe2+ transport